ncbi:hypothetical protein [Desulfomicrobium baculatum]|uniref:Uncharacterized protein n=1 Tax=Desulfomicrobium baculatum (strain DSM 4028 / VKM B-1378 / X) TaxID=525897 RepID=C7LXM9_DESBD|nr:hypothetical protein [Desulfomicrobium baculatum]ACU91265.1 hypothetical protein Dbac_3190 [Desulfomicrobium baculatum DSM 4028]
MFSFFLALCLHVIPVWFIIFGPLYGLPSVLELNLETINMYRERIFREQHAQSVARLDSAPLHISVDVQARPDTRQRVSKPRREADLTRARAVQGAIRSLWEGMSPDSTGYALVSLSILEDGRIGEFVVNRVSGDHDFQAFLLSFLSTLKSTYGNAAGPGEALWIECEFVIQPLARKGAS